MFLTGQGIHCFPIHSLYFVVVDIVDEVETGSRGFVAELLGDGTERLQSGIGDVESLRVVDVAKELAITVLLGSVRMVYFESELDASKFLLAIYSDDSRIVPASKTVLCVDKIANFDILSPLVLGLGMTEIFSNLVTGALHSDTGVILVQQILDLEELLITANDLTLCPF